MDQKKSGKFLNITLFLIMLAFLVYYISILFKSGGSEIFDNMKIIGLIVALAGSVLGYFGISRASKGTVLRGLTMGFIVGLAVLTIIVFIMAPK